MLPVGGRPATSWVHYPTSCNTQSSVLEDGQNNYSKHAELTGIINKPLLLHLVDCLYYLYQWCTVKRISDNEICLLIKYIKTVLWRVAKRLSYIEDARCLKVKYMYIVFVLLRSCFSYATHSTVPYCPICQGYKTSSKNLGEISKFFAPKQRYEASSTPRIHKYWESSRPDDLARDLCSPA